jgi:hypothetical protein
MPRASQSREDATVLRALDYMKVGPFTIEEERREPGLCLVRLVIDAPAVQAVFDEVLRQASAAGDAEASANIIRSVRTSLVEWAASTALPALELVLVEPPDAVLEPLAPGRPAALALTCFTAPVVRREALAGLVLSAASGAPLGDSWLAGAVRFGPPRDAALFARACRTDAEHEHRDAAILAAAAAHVLARTPVEPAELLLRRRYARRLETGVAAHALLGRDVAPTPEEMERGFLEAREALAAEARVALVVAGLAATFGVRADPTAVAAWAEGELRAAGVSQTSSSAALQDRVFSGLSSRRWQLRQLAEHVTLSTHGPR